MARRLLKLKAEIGKWTKEGYNVAKHWHACVQQNGPKKAMVMIEEDGSTRSLTFAEMDRLSNQVAHWLKSEGIKAGDSVALFMENRPEFVVSWLGMTKIGAKVAMINTAIKEKGLTHCIKISDSRIVLFGSELAEQIAGVKDTLTAELNIRLFSAGGKVPFAPCADDLIAKAPTTALPLPNDVGMLSTFGYIYTSGTTGLPKAAVIIHLKMVGMGGLVSNGFDIQPNDVLYTVLPLFHSAGGGLGVGTMLYRGCTMVVRRKFSAKQFFQDCNTHNVTVFQYIGELCRYLLNTPASPADKKHKVRLGFGNGLRPDIWDTFQSRFNIPEIGELFVFLRRPDSPPCSTPHST